MCEKRWLVHAPQVVSQTDAYVKGRVHRKLSLMRRSVRASERLMHVSACLLLFAGSIHAAGNEPTLSDRDALISWVLERFWGNARDSTGAAIQPSSEIDRRTVPIPRDIAYRAIEAGEISGLGAWCGIEWETHYLSLTAAARQRKMSDKEVAFISLLHGMAQGIAFNSKSSPCSETEGLLVSAKLKSSKDAGLRATY